MAEMTTNVANNMNMDYISSNLNSMQKNVQEMASMENIKKMQDMASLETLQEGFQVCELKYTICLNIQNTGTKTVCSS